MSELKLLADDTWAEVSYWTFEPMATMPRDRENITFNHNDRESYVLLSEFIMNMPGMTCLEHFIFSRLYPGQNEAEQVFMLDIPFLIVGPGGLSEEQLSATPPPITLFKGAPYEFDDQQKVLEALLSLESKGLITITRNKPN